MKASARGYSGQRDLKAHASPASALGVTQGQMDDFFSQFPYKCYLEEWEIDFRFALNSTTGRFYLRRRPLSRPDRRASPPTPALLDPSSLVADSPLPLPRLPRAPSPPAAPPPVASPPLSLFPSSSEPRWRASGRSSPGATSLGSGFGGGAAAEVIATHSAIRESSAPGCTGGGGSGVAASRRGPCCLGNTGSPSPRPSSCPALLAAPPAAPAGLSFFAAAPTGGVGAAGPPALPPARRGTVPVPPAARGSPTPAPVSAAPASPCPSSAFSSTSPSAVPPRAARAVERRAPAPTEGRVDEDDDEERDDAMLPVSDPPAARTFLAGLGLRRLVAAARSTMSQIADWLTSSTHACTSSTAGVLTRMLCFWPCTEKSALLCTVKVRSIFGCAWNACQFTVSCWPEQFTNQHYRAIGKFSSSWHNATLACVHR